MKRRVARWWPAPIAGKTTGSVTREHGLTLFWRRKRDSNPRASYPANGFQDRRLQPLGHSSIPNLADSSVQRQTGRPQQRAGFYTVGPLAAPQVPKMTDTACAKTIAGLDQKLVLV